ncbi:hypothetical protein PLICRDRAFT_55612 [Plicaturopsis crispa FD-325 SS-3]|nr:hypothetical protein PLICRDRAFT_55612 [Plicaturopsis crispa FD-325 SS-3]
MLLPVLLVAAAVADRCFALSQSPFLLNNDEDKAASDHYQFKWPIRRVAIIGAGPSGLITYRELTKAGFEAHIYERDNVPGGNWHYTEEIPTDAPVPNAPVELSDYVPSLPPAGAQLPYIVESADGWTEQWREHSGPKPVWASLHSNVAAIDELPWPKGTEWELPHQKLQAYLRAFASFHGVNSNDNNPNVSYNTRVELIEKHYDDAGKEHGWRLTLKELVKGANDTSRTTWYQENYDAIVIATGRYNAPNVPDISGAAEWAAKFPQKISHSRQYRRPEPYANETVLIIGAATSGGEISRDINTHARKVYQSIRVNNFPIQTTAPHYSLSIFLRRLPANTTLIGAIKRFHPLNDHSSGISEGRIELENGTVITGVDRIIFSTGYRYTFPYLPQYHNSSIGINDTATGGAIQPLVTDGSHVRSLHLDLFYIEEPTIAFLTRPFGLAEYWAVALAKVWDNKAKLPSTSELWRIHWGHVKSQGGYGKHFQFLGADKGNALARYLIGWLNDAAVKYGGRQLDTIPKERDQVFSLWVRARFGIDLFESGGEGGQTLTPDGLSPLDEASKERIVNDILFDVDGGW